MSDEGIIVTLHDLSLSSIFILFEFASDTKWPTIWSSISMVVFVEKAHICCVCIFISILIESWHLISDDFNGSFLYPVFTYHHIISTIIPSSVPVIISQPLCFLMHLSQYNPSPSSLLHSHTYTLLAIVPLTLSRFPLRS